VAESVAVEELDSPLQKTQQAADTAEQGVPDNASICSLLVASGVADLTKKLDNSNQQATQSNGTKAVCQGALGGGAGGILGEVVRVKVPRAIYTSNCRVDRVLEPLRKPVHGESDKDDESNDLALAATTIGTRRVIGGGLVLDVDSDKSDRVPSRKGRGDDASDQAGKIDVTIFLANVDGSFKHESREGNSRNPCPEAECHE
jgi:hypothetical protein